VNPGRSEKMSLRKSYPSEFKAKVALEAIKEAHTVGELSSIYEVHSTLVTRWKREVLKCLPGIFSNRAERKSRDDENLIASLYQEIGKQKVELDWLKKKLGTLK
jgi:transposase-like protein